MVRAYRQFSSNWAEFWLIFDWKFAQIHVVTMLCLRVRKKIIHALYILELHKFNRLWLSVIPGKKNVQQLWKGNHFASVCQSKAINNIETARQDEESTEFYVGTIEGNMGQWQRTTRLKTRRSPGQNTSSGLKLNENKLLFGSTEVTFLGHIFSDQGVKTWPNEDRSHTRYASTKNETCRNMKTHGHPLHT